MKMKQLLSGTSVVAFAMATLFTSSMLFAQVKIGTNPTTINPASNLEVEASTPNRKTSIDKTTGQVSIADGTECAGKIFTSDVNGGGSWQNPAIQDSPVLFSVTNTISQTSNTGAIDKAIFGVKNLDRNNNFDLATNTFTVPVNGTGVYQFGTIFGTLNQGILQGVYIGIYKNGVLARYLGIGNCAPGSGIGGSGYILMQLDAGDVVDMRFIPSLQPGQSITLFHFSLSVSMLSM